MTQRIATHVPQHRGPAAWNVILGTPPAPRITKRDCSADFVIIGAGFAGLCAAIELDAAGRSRFLVVDKAHGLGGTW